MPKEPDEKKASNPDTPKSWPYIPYYGRPLNWQKEYGSWEDFMREVHKSIGGSKGSGKLRFHQNSP